MLLADLKKGLLVLNQKIMIKIRKLHLYSVLSLLFLLLCKSSAGMVIDTPVIKVGIAKLTGTITVQNNTSSDSIYVNITVPHPISGEFVKYKALVDRTGKFAIDVDVETSICLIRFNTSLNPDKVLLVKLNSGDLTNINIAYDSSFDIEQVKVTPNMDKQDMLRCFGLIGEMIEFKSDRFLEPPYDKPTAYFLAYTKNVLSERLAVVQNDTLISKKLKEILTKEFHLFLYTYSVFDYEVQMKRNYRTTNGDKNTQPVIQNIDRLFFRFLKDFNLSDPQYLYVFTFLEFQKSILQDKTLGLPLIGDSDIPSWQNKVKAILSGLVGFKDGQYYDVLAANAYGIQLNEQVRPLSQVQKENIKKYWKDGDIAKILFRKDEEVVGLDKYKTPTVINDISSIPNDKVIETIVSKYKNKVVLIDLWATWCIPCLSAMQEFRSAKSEFHNKDVVFVYLTNSSSPRTVWEEKIKGIGSEHYYLNDAQWAYVMKHFGLEYIPSYLLYNKKGLLRKKIVTFPGSDKVKDMINGLL